MKILLSKILLEELQTRFECMSWDPDFIEDNTDIINTIISVYQKLNEATTKKIESENFEKTLIEFTEEEMTEIIDEIDSCETMDYWQSPDMRNALKVFNIQIGRLVKVTEEEYEKMCEGYYINRNMCPKPKRFKNNGCFYAYKDDYDFHFSKK
jgi:hypothetical protein